MKLINPTNLTEDEVRVLRDQCFGHPSSDKNWRACREYWMQPVSIQWLLEHQRPIKCTGEK